MKKVIVFAVFILAIISLSSCRSKKNSCTKVDSPKQIQAPQQDVVVASIENE